MKYSKNDHLNNLFDVFVLTFQILFGSLILGVYHYPWRSKLGCLCFFAAWLAPIFFVSHPIYLIKLSHLYYENALILNLINYVFYLDVIHHYLILVCACLVLCFLIPGVAYVSYKNKIQKKLKRTGFKNSDGQYPIVRRHRTTIFGQQEIMVYSPGYSFKKWKENLELVSSCLEKDVQVFKTKNPALVKLVLHHSQLSKVSYRNDVHLNSPYSFCIGLSQYGWRTSNLNQVCHMLIAGTTGGGKSMCLRGILLDLNETSTRLQMYLLDLKGGVELGQFESLPNVYVASDKTKALRVLEKINAEMKRRFELMKAHKVKKINPKNHKMDRIVLAIDEASELYEGLRSDNASSKADAKEARKLTISIAKLGRAAGITLILSTQKISKDTIDTNIQENIQYRFMFKANTLHGSLNALRNSKAADLESHPGRCIFDDGKKSDLIQTPFQSDEYEKNRIHNLQLVWKAKEKIIEKDMLIGKNVQTPTEINQPKQTIMTEISHAR